MKLTEENNLNDRVWDSIILKLDHGYFAGSSPITIMCYRDGMLMFTAGNEACGRPLEKAIEDNAHGVSKKSMTKLDGLIEEIAKIDSVEGFDIEDGSSFECYVHLTNGTVTGFHYCSMFLSEKFKDLETRIRKVLREDFFLKKHKKELRF